MKHVTGLMVALGLLGACAPSTDPVRTQFFRPAGAILDDGELGGANTHNMLVQSGQRSFAHGLARRFASEVSPMVTFPFNSAQLTPEAQAVLREQANWIRQFPEVRFRVYGHTDLVGSEAYNKRLGLRRAQAVVGFLVGHGISRSRLEAVVSFGETRPLVPTRDRERLNRRTVTEVTGFVQNHPLVLDGKYAQIVYRNYIDSARPDSGLRTIENSQIENVSQ